MNEAGAPVPAFSQFRSKNMAKFRFIGDPSANGHGPDEQELFGVVFSRSDWTEVPDEVAEKAAKHSHLEQKTERARKAKDDAEDAG